jgi:hypothetical protein
VVVGVEGRAPGVTTERVLVSLRQTTEHYKLKHSCNMAPECREEPALKACTTDMYRHLSLILLFIILEAASVV